MLRIKNLSAGIEETQILKGINLEVNAGRCMLLWGLTGLEKVPFLQLLQEKKNMRSKVVKLLLMEKIY